MYRTLAFALGLAALGCSKSAPPADDPLAIPSPEELAAYQLPAKGTAPAAAPEAAPAAEVAVGPDGPESITIAPLTVSDDPAEIEKGKALFAGKGCVACHRIDETKLVGPGLKGVLSRRSVPWVQRMILNPDAMLKQDPVAKKLLAEHLTPMPAQGVDPQTELPALVAYLKSL